jgi:hypothetical protein
MSRTDRLRFFLRDILYAGVSSVFSAFFNCVSACFSILITLFPSLLSLSLSLVPVARKRSRDSLLLFLATGFSLLYITWFLGFLSFIISFFSSINIECHNGGISKLGRLITLSSIMHHISFMEFSLLCIVFTSQYCDLPKNLVSFFSCMSSK